MKNLYLQRYAWPHQLLNSYEEFFEVGFIVVIPAYKETGLLKTLNALKACRPPGAKVLVLVVVNEPETAPSEIKAINLKAFQEIIGFRAWFSVKAVHLQFPEKKAGVGLARKVGMDEAVRIFQHTGREGIIICFDSDCSCDESYFLAVEEFYKNKNHNLGLVYYEHPLDGAHSNEILNYELFLRFYIDALRYTGYPNAVQTLGSCITVRSGAYQKQGGMNTRKAGEDFYFIHKMVPIGGIGEINGTCISPSDRTSDRVPFGTGHAILKYLQAETDVYEAYNPATFQDLKRVFSSFSQLYEKRDLTHLPKSILTFYEHTGFEQALQKILKQSNNAENFRKRFFAWWDGFRVLKFVHFSRDYHHKNIPLSESTDWLIEVLSGSNMKDSSMKDKLLFLRMMDRQTNFYIK